MATGLLALPKAGSSIQTFYSLLVLSNANAYSNWVVIDEWKPADLGFPISEPLKWSADEKFFYFTNIVVPDGCTAFHRLSGLFKVNLENGELEELLSPGSTAWVALSPSEETLVYVLGDELVFRDLATGEKVRSS